MVTEVNIIDSIIARLMAIVHELDDFVSEDDIPATIDDPPYYVHITDEYPNAVIPTERLPLAYVTDGQGIAYQVVDATTLAITRSFRIELFYKQLGNDERYNANYRSQARHLLTRVAPLFFRRNRLQLKGVDSGLRFVIGAAIASDLGIGTGGWRDLTYVGTEIVINVTYCLDIRQEI